MLVYCVSMLCVHVMLAFCACMLVCLHDDILCMHDGILCMHVGILQMHVDIGHVVHA